MKQPISSYQWQINFQSVRHTNFQHKKFVQAGDIDSAKIAARLQFPELKSFSIVLVMRADLNWKQLYKRWLVNGELPPEN